MFTVNPGRERKTTATSFRECLQIILPSAAVALLLWIKLLYVSFRLRQEWWLPLNTPLDESVSTLYIFTGTIAGVLLLIAPTFLLRQSLRVIGLAGIYCGVSIIAVADSIHAAYFGCVIPIKRFAQARMLTDIGTSWSSWNMAYLWYCIDIPFVLALLILCRRSRSGTWRHCAATAAAGLTLAWPVTTLVRKDPNGLYAYTGLQGELTSFVGLLPYHFLDLAGHLGRPSERRASEQDLVDWFRNRRPAAVPRSALFGIAAGRNVIQISAESLQAFPIGLAVNGRPVTPRLNELARESLFFSNFQDQTGLGTTSDAEFLTHQSLYPLADDVVSQVYTTHHWHGSAATLAKHGYRTLSACGAPAGFWKMERMHRGFGFARSYFEPDYAGLEKTGPSGWISDRAFLLRNVEILKAQQQPFFAYFLTSTNHDPYVIPNELKKLDLHGLSDVQLVNYLQSVHLFDESIGRFVDALKEARLLDSTVLVIYGDHHGFLKDGPDLAGLLGMGARDHFAFLRNRKRVPLLVRLPHAQQAGVRKTFGGHLDVAPTILSLLGVENVTVMMGRDLTAGQDSMVVFRDGSYVDGRHFFVNRFGPIARSRCYSVATGAAVGCEALIGERNQAQDRLRVSDSIVTRNLVPQMRAALGKSQ